MQITSSPVAPSLDLYMCLQNWMHLKAFRHLLVPPLFHSRNFCNVAPSSVFLGQLPDNYTDFCSSLQFFLFGQSISSKLQFGTQQQQLPSARLGRDASSTRRPAYMHACVANPARVWQCMASPSYICMAMYGKLPTCMYGNPLLCILPHLLSPVFPERVSEGSPHKLVPNLQRPRCKAGSHCPICTLA